SNSFGRLLLPKLLLTLELHATIDTIVYTITETSIRNKLQLADASGITMLPNNEIFEGMGHMGYPTDGSFTFWKSFFTPQWRFLVHHILHCISYKSGGWNQFGSNIATALICQEHPDVSQSQPSSSTILVPSTSLPPEQSPPYITTPIPASTPIPILETDPEPMEHTFGTAHFFGGGNTIPVCHQHFHHHMSTIKCPKERKDQKKEQMTVDASAFKSAIVKFGQGRLKKESGGEGILEKRRTVCLIIRLWKRGKESEAY
ncbi:hypothetical protein Tco_0850897, partial [Tanacetum coccineum]